MAFQKNRSGASLVMVLSLIAMIVALSFGVSRIVVNSIRTGANLENADQAYYAAEGGAERALVEVKKQGVGYSTSTSVPTEYKASQIGRNSQGGGGVELGNGAKSEYTISGLIPDNPFANGDYGKIKAKCPLQPNSTGSGKGQYSFPPAGRGEAGGAECRDIGPVVSCEELKESDGNLKQDGSFVIADPADHPCNWGVLRAQEAVEIPLYVSLGNDTYRNPAYTMTEGNPPSSVANKPEETMSSFVMRFRAPCVADPKTGVRPTVCSDKVGVGFGGREELDVSLGEVASWKILAKEWGGSGIGGDISLEGKDKANQILSTAVFSNFINKDPTGSPYRTINSFLNGAREKGIEEKINSFLFGNKQHKLTLKLVLNKPLKSSSSEGIPYLEYQLIGNTRFSDLSPRVDVKALQNNVKTDIRIQPSTSRGVLDFVVD